MLPADLDDLRLLLLPGRVAQNGDELFCGEARFLHGSVPSWEPELPGTIVPPAFDGAASSQFTIALKIMLNSLWLCHRYAGLFANNAKVEHL